MFFVGRTFVAITLRYINLRGIIQMQGFDVLSYRYIVIDSYRLVNVN